MKYLKILTTILTLILITNIALATPPAAMTKSQLDTQNRDEAKWRRYFTHSREHSFDVIYYDIHVTPNPQAETVAGTNNITALSKEEALSEITLDYGPSDYMGVNAITMNGTNLDYNHSGEILTIYFDNPLAFDQEFTISIDYSGEPVTGMYFGNGEIATFTEPSDSRYWYPCWDHPLDKADSVSVHVTIPAAWEVVTNGLLTGIDDNGDTKTHHWHTNYPTSTYLIAFAAAENYEVIDMEYQTQDGGTMPIPNYVFDWQVEIGELSFSTMPEMITILSDLFGEYPFVEEKYGQVASSAFGGGMEHQTITFLHPGLIDGQFGTQVWLYSHELAHQWWGDAVTLGSWADMWLNEGFASYAEALYWEELGYDIREWTVGVMLESYLGINYEHPIYDPPPGFLFSTIEYEKAGLVLNMLRGIVGKEIFLDILHYYYNQHAYGNAFTDDFQAACEEIYPDYDWETFFQQWIYGMGYPIFDVKWDYWPKNDGTYQVEAILEQIQSEEAGLYVMPTEVGTCFDAYDEEYELQTIQIDSAITYVNMIVENEPVELAFDPWEWLTIKETEITKVDKFTIQSTSISDSESNNNKIFESGEALSISVELFNHLSDAQDVTGIIDTDDPNIEIINNQVGFDDIMGGQIGGCTTAFTISLVGDIAPHSAEILMQVSDANGYFNILSFDVFVGKGDILLVDDDDGADYETYYTESLENLGLIPHPKDVALTGIPNQNMLNEFSTVIWFTGNSSENTLMSLDQENLAQFLDNGGNLFLTGQDISDEIGDTPFFANYLHAQHINDSHTGTLMLKGADGDPIGNGISMFISGSEGANNQDSPSDVEPIGDGQKIFGYMPPHIFTGAAVRYEGDYKTVFFGFGFEAVSQNNSMVIGRTELMQSILSYLGVDVDIKDNPTGLNVPTNFALKQNYPNPFNPNTTIAFTIPQDGAHLQGGLHLTLKIYDVSGKLIKTLVDSKMEPGYHSVVWNGKDESGKKVSSGIYYYRLEGNGFNETKSMILLK